MQIVCQKKDVVDEPIQVELGKILQIALITGEKSFLYILVECQNKTHMIKYPCDGMGDMKNFHEDFTLDSACKNRFEFNMCVCRFDENGNINGIGHSTKPYFRTVEYYGISTNSEFRLDIKAASI